MRTLRALDLFCGTGSVSIGLRNGGFQRTVGIDNDPKCKQHFPFNAFRCEDVLTLSTEYLRQFDFIWASPPCQAYSVLNYAIGNEYPELIPQVIAMLENANKPYVIENVPSPKTPLRVDLMLCGSMFNLRLRRHRIFQSNIPFKAYFQCSCQKFYTARYSKQYDPYDPNCVIDMTGGNYGARVHWIHTGETRRLPWKYATQAIPPIYAQHIAEQAVRYIYKEYTQ